MQKGDENTRTPLWKWKISSTFLERGFNITGFDMSEEMLKELYKKAPKAKVFQSSIQKFSPKEKYDYIFITSGSFSLFLDEDIAFNVLVKMKEALAPKGKFVFAAETTANIISDREEYLENCHVKTKEGYDIIFKSKSFYDKHKKYYPHQVYMSYMMVINYYVKKKWIFV
ncbi:class I SAM-dependent methyltransferase [Clostridium botulinum]|nr:class I SAM-dependent methyltransferase [Clostridium botulinum]